MAKPRETPARDPHASTAGTFTILRAGQADTRLASEAVVGVHERTPCDEAALADFLSDPANYLLLAVEGDRVVGSLNGYALRPLHRREQQFLLYEIDVRPECQNRGIGTALVGKFIAEARAAGAFEVWVLTNQSNASAMAVYTRCGLRRENPDDVMLSLALDDGEKKSGPGESPAR
jgi:ribosomal protein S18 acetylase RimI-like enzyme